MSHFEWQVQEEPMRLPASATALTLTPGRRLQHTQPDMAPAWSSHVLQQPGNVPASLSPALRPGWPHHQLLCWGLRLLCPGCSPHAPRAAAHEFYISSAGEFLVRVEKKRKKNTLKERLKGWERIEALLCECRLHCKTNTQVLLLVPGCS